MKKVYKSVFAYFINNIACPYSIEKWHYRECNINEREKVINDFNEACKLITDIPNLQLHITNIKHRKKIRMNCGLTEEVFTEKRFKNLIIRQYNEPIEEYTMQDLIKNLQTEELLDFIDTNY